jgi:hypothetical protein
MFQSPHSQIIHNKYVPDDSHASLKVLWYSCSFLRFSNLGISRRCSTWSMLQCRSGRIINSGSSKVTIPLIHSSHVVLLSLKLASLEGMTEFSVAKSNLLRTLRCALISKQWSLCTYFIYRTSPLRCAYEHWSIFHISTIVASNTKFSPIGFPCKNKLCTHSTPAQYVICLWDNPSGNCAA